MFFLTSRPGWVLILLLFIFTALAMTGPFLVRLRIRLAQLRGNNEVAGFKFAVIGVLYAVLLAFVVIISWERFYDAEKALAREAGAAATIYRLSGGLDESSTAAVHENLAAYLRSVLADEWPAMVRGRSSAVTTRVLSDLYEVVVRVRPAEFRDANVQKDLLTQLDELTRARRERLVMAEGTVPPVIWFVIFLGAALTVSFTFFFGTENLIAQSLMTGILAGIILSAVLVVIALDRPYTGAIVVSKEAIRAVLEDFRTAP
ncbi:MAG TPA: DUF4239 domain-containing protein [Steroidobacteraceae bacterium]|jgi:tetrahydromethanopterin S-methyltransferase subunit F|nr:DUF4239 domain-containing protein [Steroidobacteraceae bacterium]